MRVHTTFAIVISSGLAAASFVARASEPTLPAISPDEALHRLQEGNERFVTGAATYRDADADRRKETAANGQHPFVTVLSCSDSRVPVERIFDCGVGDLFAARVAGNVADTDEIGTIEYGAGHLHTPLLVVLGHTRCGAVTAVVEGAEVHGSIPALVDNIGPAAAAAHKANPALNGKDLVPAAIRQNVWQSIEDVCRRSGEVRELASEGKLKIVGALYDIENGNVEWLGEHPEQSRLMAHHGPDHATHHAGHDSAVAQKHAAPAQPRARHHASVQGPSPSEVLMRLQNGNNRYVSGRMQNPNCGMERVRQTAAGQHPIATILSCADSRVPVELVFDQGVGDLFVVRVAGNVADTDETGSIEYGTDHLGTPLLVVLGHSACGAVTAVANNSEVHGCIPPLVDNIRPALEAARKSQPELSGDPLVAAAIKANVFQSMEDLLRNSAAVRGLAQAGSIMIVGGLYDLASGQVEWLGPHPRERDLLAKATEDRPNSSGRHVRKDLFFSPLEEP